MPDRVTAQQMVHDEEIAGHPQVLQYAADAIARSWAIELERALHRPEYAGGVILGPLEITSTPDLLMQAVVFRQSAVIFPDTPRGRNEAMDWRQSHLPARPVVRPLSIPGWAMPEPYVEAEH